MSLEKSAIQSLVAQADQLFHSNHLEQACQLYSRVCQLDPQQVTAWLQLASAQYALEQFLPCLHSVEQILNLEAGNLRALLIGSAALLELSQFDQAIRLAEEVLAREADNLPALLNKSTALLRLGRCKEALTAAEHALMIDSSQVTAQMNRGMALFGLGQYQPALLAFEQVLALRPGYLNALINRSSVLYALGRYAEALQAADEALAAQPNSVSALLNRAAALLGLQRPLDALTTLDRVLANHPKHLKALLNKSVALQELKRFSEALQTAEIALTVNPAEAAAWQNKLQALLGMERYAAVLTEIPTLPTALQSHYEIRLASARALLGLRRYEEALRTVEALFNERPPQVNAILLKAELLLWLRQTETALTCLEQGLTLYPNDSDLLVNKSLVSLLLGQNSRALTTIEGVLAKEVQHHKALLIKANILNNMGRFQEALQIAETLSARQVNEWQVYASLGEALAGLKRFAEARRAFTDARRLGAKYYRDGQFNDKPLDAVTEDIDPRAVYLGFEVERLARCEWTDYQTKIASIRKLTEDLLAEGAHTPLPPFHSLSLPLPPSLQLAIASNQANYIKAGTAEIKRSQGFTPVRRAVDRLRIGYVSADFRYHPTAHLMRSLFKIHDRRGFEIYGYALNKDDGSRYYSQIKADCDHFIDLTELSNAQAAQRIYEDGIHILVDLMGYTKYARTEIFALQPAPIQVSYLGFPGTLGADFIHYIIADSTVLPVEQAEFFTEQPVYLPDCYQVNDRWQEIAETGISRADQGLPEKGFVFCCFNQANKLDPVMFTVWMRILKELPGSVLWLLSTQEEMQDNLRREAEAHGVAGERLIFAKHLPKDRHLERHRLADLFLDTRLYNAHTTASDALWAGLPVLTCRGQAFAARVGASLLQAVGLPQLITENLEEYHRLAIHLATHPQELLELRNRLLKNRLSTPLFDTERFVRHLEQGYRIMWARYQRAEEPQVIRVTPLAPADSSEPTKRANFRLWPWKPWA